MSNRLPPIPAAPRSPDMGRSRFDQTVRESLLLITGRLASRIEPLESTASTSEIIEKVNELLARLQD